MSFYMANTEIEAAKTAGEISEKLSSFGATQILTTYENRQAVGLAFKIMVGEIEIPFCLPIRWEPVLKGMRRANVPSRLCTQKQATRVAWRLVFRWIQAQLALVQAGGADLQEVFLPYAHLPNGLTVYQVAQANQFKMLEAPR